MNGRKFGSRTLGLMATGAALFGAAVAGPDSSTAQPAIDWVIDLDPADPGEPLPTSLLGHYDLSGDLLGYDQDPALVDAMRAVGFSDWRVGVGRWEASTLLMPTLSDGVTPCPIFFPESAAPAGWTDLDLVTARDWLTDDGFPVSLADTQDDSRYDLAYVRRVLDVVDVFGATPFVSIDSMPFALALNQTPLRLDCEWSFQNQVSNVAPQDPVVFGAAVAGMVERIVEGDASGAARPVTHWEIWNEPEFPQFWDPAFEDPPGTLNRFFAMAINALVALDGYRSGSTHPNAAGLRFGVGSFGTDTVAAGALTSFDSAPIPGGYVPLDFISFHAYSNDPLDVVAAIETVATAAAATVHYPDIELALAEWGPNLAASAGDPVYAASIQPALHIATVIALGATAGLDRAHRAIFWDFYPNSIQLGLVDHDLNPRSAYRAYELLARTLEAGAVRVQPSGLPDGRLDAGLGAVLASRDGSGTWRVLLVNRNTVDRTAEVRLDGAVETPTRLLVYADPAAPIVEVAGSTSEILVPAESLVLAEFEPPPVPVLGPLGGVLLATLLVGAARRVGRSARSAP